MKSVTVSAPGKIHLMGEHAIVYGNPALLSAIDLRLSVTIVDYGEKENEVIPKKSAKRISQAIAIIRSNYSIANPTPVQVSIFSDIPSGFHLGSSAAVAVALTGALMKFDTDQFDREKINVIAYEVEKMFHGNPSGGDNTTITHGGYILYQKFSETDKQFTPMIFPDSLMLGNFYLIHTGKPESTKEMIASVKQLFEKDQRLKDRILIQNEQATKMVLEAIKNADEHLLITGIRNGEKTLEAMGVVSDKATLLIRDIEKLGGAAKILGGGGKKDGVGFLLCYDPSCHSDPDVVGRRISSMRELVHTYGYTIQPVRLGESGVRVEAVPHDIIAS